MKIRGLWDTEIERINDTTDRLLRTLDDIVPQTHASLESRNQEEMGDEEREFFGDFAYDQLEIAEHATAAGKQIIPVVIQSYLENWLQTIWKRTRKAKLRRKPRERNTVDHVLHELGVPGAGTSIVPGYADAIECWQIANSVKHDVGKAKVAVTLVGGEVVPVGTEIDYSQLRFNVYSVAVVQLLTAVAKHALSTRPSNGVPPPETP